QISIGSCDNQNPLDFESIRAVAANCTGFEFSQIGQVPRSVVLKRTGGMEATLFWDEEKGELYTTQPEADIVAGMMNLAGRIGGRVRGQNFETYKTPYESFEHPDDRRLIEQARADFRRLRRKQAWKDFGKKMTIPLGIAVVVLVLNGPWFWPQPPVYARESQDERTATLANSHVRSRSDAIFVPLDDFDFRFVAELARQANAATGLV